MKFRSICRGRGDTEKIEIGIERERVIDGFKGHEEGSIAREA
jgi:hypothetical protein